MLISEPPKRSGLRDVAKIADCPYQTVSRVINDDARVSEETRERILVAVEATGYRRNAAARAPVIPRPGMIGTVSDRPWCYGPMGTLHGVEEAARSANHSTLLTVQEWGAFKFLKAALRRFTDAFVGGIVVIAPLRAGTKTTRKVATSFSWAGGLSVAMLAPDSRPTPGIQVVAEGQKSGTRLATHRLVRLGHQHIVHLAGNQKQLDGNVRLEGWREELLSNGLLAPEPIFGDLTGRSGYHAGVQVIKEGLSDAIFAASNLMTLGTMRAFSEASVRIPEDVSVVDSDDHELAHQLLPLLTTVCQDFKVLDLRCLKISLSDSDDDYLSEPIRLRLLVRLNTYRKAQPQPRAGRTGQHVGSTTSGFPIRSRFAQARCAGSLMSIPTVHPVTP